MNSLTQEIYITNFDNELKILDVSNFSVTNVLTVDIATYGVMQDIAFNPQGRLFATTGFNNLIEIDLLTQQISILTTLPSGATYPGLVANSNNELITSKFLQLELYAYNIDTQVFNLVGTGISTPGDFTYYKGNLIYPNIFNDFIKAYDGTDITNVGCSVPLLYGITNVFEDCQTNTIYAFDEDAKVYIYTLGESEFEEVADLWSVTGPIYGAATRNEYMASDCTLETIETVTCDILAIHDTNPLGISIFPNPAENLLNVRMPSKELTLTFRIWNLSGKELSSGILENDYFDINSLANGIYFLQIFENSNKLVFQKQILKI
jgi:hypothetical protein